MKSASKFAQTFSVSTDPVTGTAYTSQYDIFTVGAGYLDIQAAIAATDIVGGTAQSPTATYDSATGNVYLINNPAAVWDTNAIWGSNVVWGSIVMSSGEAAARMPVRIQHSWPAATTEATACAL